MKHVCFLIFAMLLVACSSDRDPYYANNLRPFVLNEDDFVKDSLVYVKDSMNIVDVLEQEIEYRNTASPTPYLVYEATARNMAISVQLVIAPSEDGGAIKVNCGSQKKVEFFYDNADFPLDYKGYVIKLKDSLVVSGETYHDIMVFDASGVKDNQCDMGSFYYAANNGLVRVVSKNGVELNRIGAREYEIIREKLATERAVADSIAQAVADSIAQAAITQALADSIAKAYADSIRASTQDTVDLEKAAEDLYNCIMDAGSVSSWKDLKGCLT